STYIGVLHRYGPPFAIDLAHHASADAGALWLINVTMYVKLRMHHGHVRCQKADMHNWRLASTRPEWPTGTVKSPHQIQVVGAGLGPCTIDSDELSIIG